MGDPAGHNHAVPDAVFVDQGLEFSGHLPAAHQEQSGIVMGCRYFCKRRDQQVQALVPVE